jgi:hypothetical protein
LSLRRREQKKEREEIREEKREDDDDAFSGTPFGATTIWHRVTTIKFMDARAPCGSASTEKKSPLPRCFLFVAEAWCLHLHSVFHPTSFDKQIYVALPTLFRRYAIAGCDRTDKSVATAWSCTEALERLV